MRIHRGGWAHRQRVSTTFFTRKNSQIFLVLLMGGGRGLNLRSSDLEFDALPTEPPRHPVIPRGVSRGIKRTEHQPPWLDTAHLNAAIILVTTVGIQIDPTPPPSPLLGPRSPSLKALSAIGTLISSFAPWLVVIERRQDHAR